MTLDLIEGKWIWVDRFYPFLGLSVIMFLKAQGSKQFYAYVNYLKENMDDA